MFKIVKNLSGIYKYKNGENPSIVVSKVLIQSGQGNRYERYIVYETMVHAFVLLITDRNLKDWEPFNWKCLGKYDSSIDKHIMKIWKELPNREYSPNEHKKYNRTYGPAVTADEEYNMRIFGELIDLNS